MAKDTTTEGKQEGGGNAAKDASNRKKQRVRTGVAIGIGSAAIVAALLYANRGRKGEQGEG
jgi:hypothetical protein